LLSRFDLSPDRLQFFAQGGPCALRLHPQLNLETLLQKASGLSSLLLKGCCQVRGTLGGSLVLVRGELSGSLVLVRGELSGSLLLVRGELSGSLLLVLGELSGSLLLVLLLSQELLKQLSDVGLWLLLIC
jgi:hypothetical protein